jgi:hypothetical protein
MLRLAVQLLVAPLLFIAMLHVANPMLDRARRDLPVPLSSAAAGLRLLEDAGAT